MEYNQLSSEEKYKLYLRKKRRKAMMKRRRRFFSFLFVLIIVSCFLVIRSCNNGSEANVVSKTSVDNSLTGEDVFTVCLDPGHGDFDSGADSKTFNVFEKDIVLDVSLLVGKVLKDNSINVIYTRINDDIPWTTQLDSLKGRCEISNTNNADVFISIHCNYYKNSSSIKGTEVWCEFKDTEDEKLAQKINDRLSKINYTEDRGLKYKTDSKLYVLENTHATSVLVELGYLSNTNDTIILKSEKGKNDCANAIAKAIIEYRDSIKDNGDVDVKK